MNISPEKKRPIRVLNVAETIKGGISTYLATLEAGRDALGCDFHYLVPEGHDLDVDQCKVTRHDAGRGVSGILKLCARTVSVVRLTKPDVVFAHSTFAGLAVCLARLSLGTGVRVFYCPHGWAQFRDSGSVVRAGVRMIERLVSYVPHCTINISASEHKEVLGRGFSCRCVLVPNTVVDAQPKQAVREDRSRPMRVLFVGRFDRQKGVDVLFDAMGLLQERGIDHCRFDIVGDAVLDKAHPVVVPVGKHVRDHGWLSGEALSALYREADVLVMPSRWEGFGLCALEAFRAGTPVIASRVGGLKDIVTEGHDGYFFDGTPEGLASRLTGLPLDELQTMGQRARRTYDSRFHPTRFYRSYRELFHDVPGGVVP